MSVLLVLLLVVVLLLLLLLLLLLVLVPLLLLWLLSRRVSSRNAAGVCLVLFWPVIVKLYRVSPTSLLIDCMRDGGDGLAFVAAYKELCGLLRHRGAPDHVTLPSKSLADDPSNAPLTPPAAAATAAVAAAGAAATTSAAANSARGARASVSESATLL